MYVSAIVLNIAVVAFFQYKIRSYNLAALMDRNWTHRSMLNLMRRQTIIIATDCA